MGSDVEMEDVKIQVTNTSPSKISIPVLVHLPSPAPSQSAQPQPTAKPVSATKPKSTKTPKARSPSPSPPPPAPVIPLRTIRLDIPLGGPSNYEVDIGQKSKETGQREPTPPQTKVADSSDEEDEDDEKKDKPKRKKGMLRSIFLVFHNESVSVQRKNVASEYYDTSDPFIDDSELALDERQFFAQTKQQGFYVSSGEVALFKDKYVAYLCRP